MVSQFTPRHSKGTKVGDAEGPPVLLSEVEVLLPLVAEATGWREKRYLKFVEYQLYG